MHIMHLHEKKPTISEINSYFHMFLNNLIFFSFRQLMNYIEIRRLT